MIKLQTPLGEFYVRPTEIIAVAPERNRPGCSLIYTSLFPDGLSVDMSTLEIVGLIFDAEAEEEFEIEFTPEDEEEEEAEEEGEEETKH